MITRRLTLSCLFLSLLAAPAFAENDQAVADSQDAEAKKITGTWKLTSLIQDGKPADADKVGDMTLIFEKDQYTYKGRSGERHQGTFAIDAKKKPKVMVTTQADGAARGKPVLRIYEWIDKDTLRFCSPGSGETAPKDFSAPAGSGRELAIWTRQKT